MQKSIINFLLGFFFLLSFSSNLYSDQFNIGNWSSNTFKAIKVLPYDNQNIIAYDQRKKAYKYNLNDRSLSTLSSNFQQVYVDENNILWGLHDNGSIYYLSKSIWKKIDIDYKFKNFKVFDNKILTIFNKKILVFDLFNGEEIKNEQINSIDNIKQFFPLRKNQIIVLDSKNILNIINFKNNVFNKSKNNAINRSYTKAGKLFEQELIKINEKTNKIKDKKFNINFQSNKDNLVNIDTNVEKIFFANKDFIGVELKKNEIKIIALNFIKIKSINFKNKIKILDLNIDSYNNIITLDGKRIFTSPFTVQEYFSNNEEMILENLYYQKFPGFASQIFSGPDGLFRISMHGEIQVLQNNNKFKTLPGRLMEISNSAPGELWGINSIGRIFYFKNGFWTQIKGVAKSISAKGANVLIIDHKNHINKFDWRSNKFKKLPVKANRVFVQNNNSFWIIKTHNNTSHTQLCEEIKCKRVSGHHLKISISPEGIAFALDKHKKLLRWDGKKFQFLKSHGHLHSFEDFAAFDKGSLWVLDKHYEIHAPKLKEGLDNFIDKYESFKNVIITENQTVGHKDGILYDKIAKRNQIDLSAYAPNGGFDYKTNYRIKTISNSHYFSDFNFGKDGRLWALTLSSPYVYQYHEKSKIFKSYTSGNFNKPDQEYLKLPTTTIISSIVSDKLGRIWTVQKDSRIVKYQEKRKGIFKSTTLPPGGASDYITDITINNVGEVYLAAKDIYKWDERRKRFDHFIRKDGPFVRLSAGPAGSLWAVNSRDDLFELEGKKLSKRPDKGKMNIQDVDISIQGEVYATNKTEKGSNANETYFTTSPYYVSNRNNVECELLKYNNSKGKFEKVFAKNKHYAQFVAVAADGTPWTVASPCFSTLAAGKNVYMGIGKVPAKHH